MSKKKGPRPNARRHQGTSDSVRAPKRMHSGTGELAGRCEECKFPLRSDGYQGHHSDCSQRACDDYIDDVNAPETLRKFLTFARAPAHGAFLPKPHPRLFADYEGKRVRVTMASTFGDVGITTDLTAEMGYGKRVLVSQLSNFSDNP